LTALGLGKSMRSIGESARGTCAGLEHLVLGR
jgi:hypothetical protein